MIDPHWLLEDLDPHTWRAIGRYFLPSQYIMAAQPGERGLFVVHDGGTRPRAVDSLVGVRTDLPLAGLRDPRKLAQDLYADGEWDRVHVIDRRHLEHVAREAQSSPRRELTLDEYYHLVYSLIWDGSDGYVAEPPHPGHWHGWTFSRLRALATALPSSCALALCVLDGPTVHIGLVLGLDNGRVVRVTTLEGLQSLPPAAIEESYLKALRGAITTAVAPAEGVLLCTREAFDAWMFEEDKDGALAAAQKRGDALLWMGEKLADAVGS